MSFNPPGKLAQRVKRKGPTLVSDFSDAELRKRHLSDDDTAPARESEQLALVDTPAETPAKTFHDEQVKYPGTKYNPDFQAGLDRRFGSLSDRVKNLGKYAHPKKNDVADKAATRRKLEGLGK